MVTKIKIGDHWVGDGEPCFIIAEAGSNHNGSLEQAQRLIDVAVEAKADAVKFQLFRAKTVYPKNAGRSQYLNLDRPIHDIIAEMEMPYEWLPQLAAYCHEKAIIFLCSVTDDESIGHLDPWIPAYKIASYEMTHIPLVRSVARMGKPVIMSTGTANLEEVAESVEVFLETGNSDLMLMQCTGSYPAPLDSLNLKSVITMKQAFGVPVGFSDHSLDALTGPVGAVSIGANLLEKHYTLSKRLPGPDHAFSLEPSELRLMVQKVREVELALGTGDKTAHPVELELRRFARRSIFAIRDIAEGDVLSPETIAVLRCGELQPGLEPKHYDELLGRIATRNISTETSIHDGDYA